MNIWQILATIITTVLLAGTGQNQDNTLIKLHNFLQEKGSPIPALELIKYDNWRMIVALSVAESGGGKYMAGTFNAWGIKDFESGSLKFGQTRDFESWEESIRHTSELLYKYDPIDGMPSPRGMVQRWKYVLPYEHWINNVQYTLYDIDRQILS